MHMKTLSHHCYIFLLKKTTIYNILQQFKYRWLPIGYNILLLFTHMLKIFSQKL